MRRKQLISFTSLFLVAGFTGACAKTGSSTEPVVKADTPEPSAAPATASAPVEAAPSAVQQAPFPMMPLAVTSFGAAWDGGKVWILGGYHGEPHNYAHDEQSGELWGFDPKTGQWSQGPSVEGLQSLTLESVDGRLVRVGGMRAQNTRPEPARLGSVAEVQVLEPGASAWTDLPDLPAPRSSHDTTVHGSKVYVVGGWTMDPDQEDSVWAKTVAVLDLSQDAASWTEIDAPFQARALGAVATDKELVVVGGMTAKGPTTAVHVYDFAKKKWSKGPDLPGLGFGVGAVAREGQVYATGFEGKVYRLDGLASGASKARWVEADRLVFGRLFPRLVDTDAGMWVLGGVHGMTTDDRIAHLEPIELDAPAEPRFHRWVLDNPSDAKNRQGMGLIGDRLIAVGGNRSLGQHDFEPEHFSAQTWELHLTSMRWEARPDFPVARQSMRVHEDRGDLLIAGGFGHGGEAARTFDEIYQYVGETAGEATPYKKLETTLPQALTQFSLVLHDKTWWTIGGLDFDAARGPKEMFQHTSAIHRGEAKAGASKFETAKVEMPGTRRAFAGAELDGKFYMAGGMRESFATVDDCQVFDLAKASWSKFACPSAVRINADMVAVGKKLYLVGGSRNGDPEKGAEGLVPDRSIEVYDPAKDSWSVLVDDIGLEPKHMRALAWGEHILMFTTHNEEGRADVVVLELPPEVSGGR